MTLYIFYSKKFWAVWKLRSGLTNVPVNGGAFDLGIKH